MFEFIVGYVLGRSSSRSPKVTLTEQELTAGGVDPEFARNLMRLQAAVEKKLEQERIAEMQLVYALHPDDAP